MRQALLESYRREDAARSLIREAIDMSIEEPDHAHWYLSGGPLQQGDPTVGGGALGKDLVDSNYAEIRKQAFILYYSSPFVRGITRTLRKFIFGKGVEIELKEENISKKKQAEEYLDEWKEANKWDMVQKESSDRTFRDGETFWHNRWMGSKKVPRLEIIEPDDVRSDLKNASHGIELDPKDPTTVKRYHIKKSTSDLAEDGMFISGQDMVHMKINVDGNVKRGRSLYEPVFRYFKWHDDWLQSRIVLNKVRSAVALVRTVEGTQVQGQMIRKQTETSNLPMDRRRRATSTMFRSGSILTAGPGVKYEMLSAQLGATDAAQDGRNILLAIAVGVGFPEMFLTADFSNANYASTAVAQNPFVREFEDWQDFFDFHIRMEMKRVLEMGIKAGLVKKDTDLKVTCKFPPLTYEDFVQTSTALGQIYLNEIISAHTYASKLGFDYDEEKKLRDEEQAALGQDNQPFDTSSQDGQQQDNQAGSQDFLQSDIPDSDDDLEESTLAQKQDRLKALLKHQKKNTDKRRFLQQRQELGSPHAKTLGVKKGNYERRQARIDKLIAKIKAHGGKVDAAPSASSDGTDDVRSYTKRSKTGKVFTVQAYTRKSRKHKELEDAKITHVEALDKEAKGINTTLIVDYAGGKGVFKPASGEAIDSPGTKYMYQKEIIASDMGTELGMEKMFPATVERSIGKFGKGALMEYINGKMKNGLDYLDLSLYDKNDLSKLYDPFLNKMDKKQVGMAAAFDYITGQRDRHPKNWKTDGTRLGLIDHGNAFGPNANFIARSNFGAYAQRKKFKIKDVIGDSWDDKWPVLESVMTTHGMEAKSISLVKQRFDELIKLKNAGKGFQDLSIEMIDKIPEKLKNKLNK